MNPLFITAIPALGHGIFLLDITSRRIEIAGILDASGRSASNSAPAAFPARPPGNLARGEQPKTRS